jgi:hypothetical protein
MAGKPTGDAQHGAIATDDQPQIAILANAMDVCNRVMGKAGVGGRLCFKHDLTALVHEEMRNEVQCLDGPAGSATRCNRLVLPDESDASE